MGYTHIKRVYKCDICGKEITEYMHIYEKPIEEKMREHSEEHLFKHDFPSKNTIGDC